MPRSSPRPIDALGGVPGTHLGLTWSATSPGDLDDVVDLTRRCEDVDGERVHVPRVILERQHGEGSIAMVGRDRRGSVRAAATVRVGPGGDEVAIRALVDPAWRGRGVGRAVLAWQDGWARDLLAGSRNTTVAVPIAAHLIDRRRLYTAAGFSCRARVELHSRRQGDDPDGSREPTPSSPALGWTVRTLGDDAASVAALSHRGEQDRHAFVSTGLTIEDLVATCDPVLSRVAVSDGVVRAAVLAHATTDRADRPVGWIRVLLAEQGSAPVAPDLLAAVFHEMWAAGLQHTYLYATPAMSALWRPVLADLACEPLDAELLYSIETP